MKRTILLVVVGWLLASCGGTTEEAKAPAASPTPSTPPNTIMMANNSFSPSPLEIKTGTEVTWSNIGTYPHNVVSVEKLFNSHPNCKGDLSSKQHSGCFKVGETFTYTFAKAGTYQYFCAIHGLCEKGNCQGMVGTVIVA